jgi:hypothetical protein
MLPWGACLCHDAQQWLLNRCSLLIIQQGWYYSHSQFKWLCLDNGKWFTNNHYRLLQQFEVYDWFGLHKPFIVHWFFILLKVEIIFNSFGPHWPIGSSLFLWACC